MLNYFHLHLSDDQGWRIVINGWPNLTGYGSGTQVGGSCSGCYYTQARYTEIVNYAAARYITVVPEIDMPGHTNAALASYPSLTCDGVAPPRRTDTAVGSPCPHAYLDIKYDSSTSLGLNWCGYDSVQNS